MRIHWQRDMDVPVATFFQLFGVLSFLLVGLKTVTLLCRIIYTVLGPMLRLNTDFKSMGQWAVVTGSTDGIGKSYAKQLAKCGMDIVLISRSEQKLKNVAAEIESTYKVKTKIVVVDFTGGPDIYEMIKTEIQGLDIGVLVNNVGMAYIGYFMNIPNGEKLFQDVINCNVVSLVTMTRICLPGMVKKNKGVILNIASAASVVPLPFCSVYSGSKAFIDKFTLDLQLECHQYKDIVIQCVLPAFVSTKMTEMSESFFVPGPDDYVHDHLKTVGLLERTAGYRWHRLQFLFFEVVMFFFPAVLKTVYKHQMQKQYELLAGRLYMEKKKE